MASANGSLRLCYVERGIGGMRDILEGLSERLRSVAARYADEVANYSEARNALEAKHRETIAALNAEQSALEQLMRLEAERTGQSRPEPVLPSKPKLSLLDFLLTKAHADGPIEKDELRRHAELAGYFADGEAGGRKVHTTLMNLASAGRLHRLPDGRYAFPERGHLRMNSDLGQQPVSPVGRVSSSLGGAATAAPPE
jgi:hypothetical protein